MPKARYGIMRDILGKRGALAHRMMTQTASIQCAFDFASDEDWTRKFRASALLAPAAVALFANSSRVDGKDSGTRRTAADLAGDRSRPVRPPRDRLRPGVLDRRVGRVGVRRADAVPAARHRLAPVGGPPFRALLDRAGCDAVTMEDWELHLSSIFTEVRSYTYVEVRSADLTPDDRILAVPALWTGILYDDDALDRALSTREAVRQRFRVAARDGRRGEGRPVRPGRGRAPRRSRVVRGVARDRRAVEGRRVRRNAGRDPRARKAAPVIGAVVLAAGASSRMGRDKSGLTLPDGRSFLDAIRQTLSVLRIDAVRVGRRTGQQRVRRGGGRQPRSLARDALVGAVRPQRASAGTDAVLVWPVDHPRVDLGTDRDADRGVPRALGTVVVPTYSGKRGHPVLFAGAALEELRALPLTATAADVVHAHEDRLEIEVGDAGIVDDIDDPRRTSGRSGEAVRYVSAARLLSLAACSRGPNPEDSTASSRTRRAA
jgi:CTP:molybdopterin cytidylyltransferase MocA